jgi:hypothetical protein
MYQKYASLFIFSGFIFCSILIKAQTAPVVGSGYLPDMSGSKFPRVVHEINFEGTGVGAGKRLNYSEVRGSPFWKETFSMASLYTYDNILMGRTRVRINFLTGEIYYLDKEERELVAPKDFVKKVVIHPEMDTSLILTVFRSNPAEIFLNAKPTDEYVQELNQGDLKLMKLTRRHVGSADSLFGTMKRYFFTTDEYYFVNFNKGIHQVKKLSRETVLTWVPNASAYDKWIADNKINFRKEEDIVRFFNYYNQQQKAAKQSAK